MPWDPTLDYKMMSQNTSDFMSLFRCSKPTIAKIRGSCVAGVFFSFFIIIICFFILFFYLFYLFVF